MQSLSNPPTLEMPFAEQGDKNTIPVQATGTNGASLTEGFPEITMKPRDQGGLPPSGRDMNGLGYLLSSLYFHLQNGGQFTFNSDVSTAIGGYPLGAILSYTDTNTGLVYLVRSLVANNTYDFNDNPSYIDDVHWTKAYSEDLQNYVTLDTAQTIGNAKTFNERLSIAKDGTVHCEVVMNSDIAKGASPATSEYFEILAQDNDTSTVSVNHRLGDIFIQRDNTGVNRTAIRAYKNTSESSTSSSVWVQVAQDGTVNTSAPACTNNNCIITQTSRSVASQNVVFGFGNGLKIATKHVSLTGGTEATWNYGITFSASPTVTICQKSGASTTSGAILWVRGAPGTASCKVYSGSTTTAMLIVVGY